MAALLRLVPLFAVTALAHDIPADVNLHLLMKPSGDRLQLAVRVPLGAIRDTLFPERSGYLDVEKLWPSLPDAAQLWIAAFIEVQEESRRLPRPRIAALQLSLESDRSFVSFDEAAARFAAPRLTTADNVVARQLFFDVLLEYPIGSARSRFSIRPHLEHFAARVVTSIRFYTPEGSVRAFEFVGDPGLFPIEPAWGQSFLRFVREGFFHILDGTDHLLFLLSLVIPFRRLRPLIATVTAFAAAHSITLIASAYGMAPSALWFPPLVETLIAASIVYLAVHNIVTASALHHQWKIAFGFGLVHGFGFSFVLSQSLQFAGSHLLTSLVSFNIGVELGQILVLLVFVPALGLVFRAGLPERTGIIVLSALVAHTGWHWMADRAETLAKFDFAVPTFTAALVASVLRWLAIACALAFALWLVKLKRKTTL